MSAIRLIHNAIIGGKFYVAGDPIPREIVPPAIRKYEVIDEEVTGTGSISLSRKYGQVYSVDDEGRIARPIRRQMAEMEAANSEQEYAEDIASEEPDQSVQDAIDEARERYSADVERQKLNAQVAAEHADEAKDAIREQHDADAKAGEFDEMDSDPRPKPKPPPSRKLFVKRKGKYVPVATAYLVPGEKLFRFRKRSFGVPAKYIMHSIVKEETSNEDV